MLIVMAAAFPITFKKMENDTEYVKYGEKVLSCSSARVENFTLPFDTTREFVTVRLVGGGAGGTATKGGGAGEVKEVTYPSLNGEFMVVKGLGGSTNQNGGSTAIYKKNDSGAWELLESARGGISANDENMSNLGETVPNALSETGGCGAGGNANSPGVAGEVKITW